MPIFTLAGTAVATAALGAAAVGTTAFTVVAGVTAFALQAGVMYGANMLVQNLAGRKTGPEDAQTGPGFSVQQSVGSGADFPRSFPLGYRVVMGSMVYANTWGEVNKNRNGYFTQVIALSDLPLKPGSEGLVGLWVNDKLCTIDWETEHELGRGHPITEYFGKVMDEEDVRRDHLWIKFYDGTQTTADTFLTDTVASEARPYGSDRIGKGVAYAIVTARLNDKMFTSFPQLKFELNGIPLYDISKDSTKGGDGAHRYNNPATWGGDGDFLPIVQAYNLLRGFYYEGEWLYGLQQMSDARLPAAAWISQIEKCREEVEEDTEEPPTMAPRYRSSMEVLVNNELGSALEALLRACQGRMSEFGGVYEPYIGEPDDPVDSFTDLDIISTEEQTFTPFFGLANTVNGVIAKYPSPNNGWNTEVAPPVYRTDLEDLSGGRRLLSDITFDTVYSARQVQQLMQESLYEAQRARKHTFELPPRFGKYKPGQVLTWNSDRNGYEDKRFRIEGTIDKPNLNVVLDLIEIDPNDYDWNTGTDYTPPVVGPGDPGYTPVDELAIAGWSVIAVTSLDSTGTIKRPGIRVGWDTGGLGDITGIHVQVRRAGDQVIVLDTILPDISLGFSVLVAAAILSAEEYEVRGRYVVPITRTAEWTSWTPVTTFDVRFEFADLSEVMNDAIFNQFRAELRELQETMQLMAASAVERIGDEWDKQERQTIALNVTRDNVTASINQLATTIIGEGGALATLVTNIAATYATQTALGDEITARSELQEAFTAFAGPDGTFANFLIDLESTYATQSALDDEIAARSTLQNDFTTFAGPGGTFATHVSSLSSTYAAKAQMDLVAGYVSTLQNEWSTFAGPGGTFATYQGTVSSTYVTNSHLTTNYATVTFNAATYATQSSLAAQYTITLDVGGRISGMKLFNGGTISTFIVQADIFQVWKSTANGGSPVPIFEVGTVDGVENRLILRGTIYADSVITTKKVADENITVVTSSIGSEKTNVGSDFPSRDPIIHQQSVTIKEGATLDVMFSGEFDFTKNDTDGGSVSDSMTIDLFIDGVAYDSDQLIKSLFSSGASRIRVAVPYNRIITGLTAGSKVFSMRCTQSNFNTGASVRTIRKPFFRFFQRLR